MSAKWTGVAEARRQFARLPAAVRDQINQATDETRKAIVAQAKSRVPVRTGALMKSITSTMDKRRGKASVKAKAPHAKFVEFGTERMPAHPFMLPAAEAERDNYVQRSIEAGKRIEREMTEKQRP